MWRASIAKRQVALTLMLTSVGSQFLYGQQEPTSSSSAQNAQPEGQNTQPAPRSAEQIQALVAPIALYPMHSWPRFSRALHSLIKLPLRKIGACSTKT